MISGRVDCIFTNAPQLWSSPLFEDHRQVFGSVTDALMTVNGYGDTVVSGEISTERWWHQFDLFLFYFYLFIFNLIYFI